MPGKKNKKKKEDDEWPKRDLDPSVKKEPKQKKRVKFEPGVKNGDHERKSFSQETSQDFLKENIATIEASEERTAETPSSSQIVGTKSVIIDTKKSTENVEESVDKEEIQEEVVSVLKDSEPEALKTKGLDWNLKKRITKHIFKNGRDLSAVITYKDVESQTSFDSYDKSLELLRPDMYDPYANREIEQPTGDFGSFSHLLKSCLGAGILAMPWAFKSSGLVLGALFTLIMGLICTHCTQMLIRSSYVLCKRIKQPFLDYPRTAEAAFLNGPTKLRRYAKLFKYIITIELIINFVLGNSVYVVLMSQAVHQITNYYIRREVDSRTYVLMLWFPLILLCMLRNLKTLVPLSIIANFFIFAALGIILFYLLRDKESFDSVDLVAQPQNWPVFVSTLIFALEGIGSVLTIEKEMKYPQHLLGGGVGLFYVTMGIVIVVHGIIGSLGYFYYGDNVHPSISTNLPLSEWAGMSVKFLTILSIFFTFALQYYVPINLLWDMLKDKVKEKNQWYVNTAVRTGLVSVTRILVPNMAPVIALIGSICSTMLGLFFPTILDILTRWPRLGVWKWHLVKNIIILVIAVMVLFAGTLLAILSIPESRLPVF